MCQGLNSHYFRIIGDGHQPNSRGLYTHYKDSYLKVGGLPSPIQGVDRPWLTWVTGVILLIGVTTPLITGRGPPGFDGIYPAAKEEVNTLTATFSGFSGRVSSGINIGVF